MGTNETREAAWQMYYATQWDMPPEHFEEQGDKATLDDIRDEKWAFNAGYDAVRPTVTVEQIAEVIARWDYVTNTGQQPDSDESLILPPHTQAAQAVLALFSNGDK